MGRLGAGCLGFTPRLGRGLFEGWVGEVGGARTGIRRTRSNQPRKEPSQSGGVHFIFAPILFDEMGPASGQAQEEGPKSADKILEKVNRARQALAVASA